VTFLDRLLPVLVVAWTVWGIYDYRKLKLALREGDREALIREYRLTIAGEVVGGVLAVAAIGSSILKPGDFGFEPSDSVRSMMFGALGGAFLGLVLQPLVAKRGKKGPPLVGDIAALIPRGGRERGWYALVALSAGIGEELVFRGFFMRLLADFGLEGAALIAVAALIFGMAHLYQGVAGVLLTTFMGALLSVVYVSTGSLIAAMVIHFLIDLRLLLVQAPAEPALDS
jgi:membrane protease YdiL (CAAX protease family)